MQEYETIGHVTVKDPQTGREVTKRVRRKICRYEPEERLQIIGVFLHGDTTVEQIIEKYHIKSAATFFSWLGKQVKDAFSLSLQPEHQNEPDMANKSKDDQIRELKEKLRQAERRADMEVLRAKAFSTIIDVAEATFNTYRKYSNLIENIVLSRPNEIWVSDITYVETAEGVCYLSLVTDAYSRKIVGWSVGPSLETVHTLNALRMALRSIDDVTASLLIHHSDRGCQYCSYAYVRELTSKGVRISMTQSGDPLENPIAERANGILKTEWLYRMDIPDMKTLILELNRIISFYNGERPHMSLGMKTPDMVHLQTGPQKRCWANTWERKSQARSPG